MSKRWVYGPALAKGPNTIDVGELLSVHGPVRPDFIDKTGFRTLYASDEDETSLDLAESATAGLDQSWWQGQVDGLIYVSSTSTLTAPGDAHLLQARLGLPKGSFILDINDACTGFVRALAVADAIITAGLAHQILLVASDTYTKLFDASELKVSPLFSDGASAIIVSDGPLRNVPTDVVAREWEILASTFLSEGDHSADLCITPDPRYASGHLTMNGGAVYTFVLRNINDVVSRLNEANTDSDEIAWCVHQGSKTVVNAVEKVVGAPRDSLFRAADYGNVVQSSIPFQLNDAGPDTSPLIGFLGFGVGLTMAGMLIRQRILTN